MINISAYFEDLFMSDATMGLDPFDENFNMRSYMDGDDYVLEVRDSSEDDYIDPEEAPQYEIRVHRIS